MFIFRYKVFGNMFWYKIKKEEKYYQYRFYKYQMDKNVMYDELYFGGVLIFKCLDCSFCIFFGFIKGLKFG